MTKRNLSWIVAVVAVALLGMLAAAPNADAECLRSPGVTEISAWNYEFFVQGYLPNMQPGEYPYVWIKVPGSSIWQSHMMTLWTVVEPCWKLFWTDLDLEPYGAGQYKCAFCATCGCLPPNPGDDNCFVFTVDSNGDCSSGCTNSP